MILELGSIEMPTYFFLSIRCGLCETGCRILWDSCLWFIDMYYCVNCGWKTMEYLENKYINLTNNNSQKERIAVY